MPPVTSSASQAPTATKSSPSPSSSSSGTASIVPPETTSVPPLKKRRRPPLACEQCRHRKVRCDRNSPCSTCVRSHATECRYVLLPPTSSTSRTVTFRGAKRQSAPTPSVAPETSVQAVSNPSTHRPGSSTVPTPRTQFALVTPVVADSIDAIPRGEGTGRSTSWSDMQTPPTSGPSSVSVASTGASSDVVVNALVVRIRELESRLSDAGLAGLAGSGLMKRTNDQTRAQQFIFTKTRVFGPSHWATLTKSLAHILELFELLHSSESHEIISKLNECKSLARKIKASRAPQFTNLQIGAKMPPRALCDQLVRLYIEAFEPSHRILHIPSFETEYLKYWDNPSIASSSFVIQLQLCLAIGSSLYDDTYSFRSDATRWIFEAQLWLIGPSEKSRLTLETVQTMCLLQFARQIAAVSDDLAWVPAGTLMRTAMVLGLHRDPRRLGPMSRKQAEVRRRLWATVLEICLHTSLESGSPPILSLDDFDTAPPADVDDSQLSDEQFDDPPLPASTASLDNDDMHPYSQTTMQILLLQSFPLRLEATKFTNDIHSSHDYSVALQLTTKLTEAAHSLSRKMARFVSSPNPAASSGTWSWQLTVFHQYLADLEMYQCMMALHIPYIRNTMTDPAFYFSRKVAIDSALRLAKPALPVGSMGASAPYSGLPAILPPTHVGLSESPPGELLVRRLAICAGGRHHTVMICVMCLTAIELLSLTEEMQRSMSPSLPMSGTELRLSLESYSELARLRIIAGETNVKGHMSTMALLAQIDAVGDGLSGTAVEARMLDAARTSIENSLVLLKSQLKPTEDGFFDTADFWMSPADDLLHPGTQDWEWAGMEGIYLMDT